MNKNILLASTSTLFGESFLDYLSSEVEKLFKGKSEILFVPYARPGGISHDEYTEKVQNYFSKLNIEVKGLHTAPDVKMAIDSAQGIFIGGGNTFLLVKQLYELDLMGRIKAAVEFGVPYLGTSAGSNLAGKNMRTTNDMPIVYPPSFDTMALVSFNINPHYLDPQPELKHNGETRETRIKEFHTQNDIPVIGLREGGWIRVIGEEVWLEGTPDARVFIRGKEPFEISSGQNLNMVIIRTELG